MIWLLLSHCVTVDIGSHCKIALGQTLDYMVSLGKLFATKTQDSYNLGILFPSAGYADCLDKDFSFSPFST